MMTGRAESVDRLVRETAARYLQPKLDFPFAVVAVGGYGRRELFPHSDIDLIILAPDESRTSALQEPLGEFLRELWDGGLRASQSVRTIAECTRLQERNIELHISLLDARQVFGDAELYTELSKTLAEFYRRHENRLLQELAALTRQRHAKFHDTVYHLEPNVKEVPGGIRDIHLLHWFFQLTQDRGPVGEDLAAIAPAREFLFAVRSFLHELTGRDNNLLTFEWQDRAAASLPDAPMDPADWMRVYYRHARQVFQASQRALEFAELKDPSLMRQFRHWRERLSSAEFTVSHDRILLRNPALVASSAESILGVFTFAARHGIPLSWDARRRLAGETKIMEEQAIPWTAWQQFFSQPRVAMGLRQMQETGLLARAIPHWSSIECLVVRDFYHRYTVDEHSIVAIETIDTLTAKKDGPSSRFHDLLLEEDDIATLRLALLLHDIGKGTLPGDHVRGSLEAASDVMEHLGVPEAKRAGVLFLIEHHLDLSLVMNGRDLEDPATARYLSSRIPTQEDLRRLALLTFADISAVNPTAMSPWRLEQLWRVYATGLEQLTRELMADRIHSTDGLRPELMEFLEGFPTRYLRTHTREQIEEHFALDRKRAQHGVAVKIRRDSGVFLLIVVAPDKPGIFAKLCGALASRGMNILKAEASSNRSGCILDLIRFDDPMHTLELNPDEVGRLEWTIECVLRDAIEVSDLLKQRRAAGRPSSGAGIAASVRFNNDASDTCTLLDFIGEDRPGLLYDLTSAIAASGCNIELVLVDTEAHKAIDVFYVTRQGGKLDRESQEHLAGELKRLSGAM
ncbi:MAG TPA: ACT domain-containing protein [Bryobacteraceae bacterium]